MFAPRLLYFLIRCKLRKSGKLRINPLFLFQSLASVCSAAAAATLSLLFLAFAKLDAAGFAHCAFLARSLVRSVTRACTLTSLFRRRSLLYDLPRYVVEKFANLRSCLRRGLKKGEPVLLCKLLALLSRDDSVLQIGLVGNEHLGHANTRVGLNLLQPIRNVVEGGLLRTIIDQDDSHRTLIISLSDCSEALLPSSVPHLQLHALVFHANCLDLKVDT